MPILSDFARAKKIDYFFVDLQKSDAILEIGSGSGWVGEYLRYNGYEGYVGMDVNAPADVVGDIKNINSLPFKKSQFDYIVAFEVIEHVDLIEECSYLLKDGGMLFLTTPLPQMDWLCLIFEKIGLNQKRTSPHSNLKNISTLPGFETIKYKVFGMMGQWGIYKKNIS